MGNGALALGRKLPRPSATLPDQRSALLQQPGPVPDGPGSFWELAAAAGSALGQELGWADGRNVRMDYRWASGDVGRMRTFAKELVELQPDVIFAATTPVTAALQRETRAIPIVFVIVSDPVGSGFVTGLPRPGGNITGFMHGEATMAGQC